MNSNMTHSFLRSNFCTIQRSSDDAKMCLRESLWFTTCIPDPFLNNKR